MQKKAFTFIELVIIMAMIGIMSAVLLVSYGEKRADKELEAAAREVAATIREAQNYALTGKDAAGGSTYTFSYGVVNDEYGISNGNNINNNYELKDGVVFSGSGGFNFTAPHGTCSVILGTPEDIELNKGGKEIHVCVYSSGKVIETDIGGSCP